MATNLWSATQQKAQQTMPNMSAVTTPSSGAYTTNVSTALKGKGVPSSQIGYNPSTNAYSVGGKPFMTAKKKYLGAGYDSPNSFNQAWTSHAKSPLAQVTPTTASTGTTAGASTSTQFNPYASSSSNMNPYNQQLADLINSYMTTSQNPQAIDPYSTAEYAAAQAQAQRAAGENTRAAQEAYGSAGFGRSYGLGERINAVQNDATNYLMTQVVPSIVAAKQAEQQNQLNNLFNAIGLVQNQQTRADNQVQLDKDNSYKVGELTGSFLDPEARQAINSLIALKQQAEASGVTADQRANLSSQADALRSLLAGMNVDPTMFGANVTAANASQNMNRAGVRTLGGQAQDLANQQQAYNEKADQRDYERGVMESDREYTYRAGRDKVGDAQWQEEFNYRAQQDGIANALAWAQHTLNEQEAANNNAYRNSSLALDREKFNYTKDQDKLDRDAASSTTEVKPVDSKTSTNNYNDLLSDLKSEGVKRAEALQLIRANSDYLSDADYRKLYEWVEDNIKK